MPILFRRYYILLYIRMSNKRTIINTITSLLCNKVTKFWEYVDITCVYIVEYKKISFKCTSQCSDICVCARKGIIDLIKAIVKILPKKKKRYSYRIIILYEIIILILCDEFQLYSQMEEDMIQRITQASFSCAISCRELKGESRFGLSTNLNATRNY